MIPFNQPYYPDSTSAHVKAALESGKTSGDGPYTRKCESFFKARYGYKNVLLTPSCTAALEMAALLAGIGPGDEVIVPSWTFVSSANAFALRGAKIVFADSAPGHPNVDEEKINTLITPATKAIVVIHYAGRICDMKMLRKMADEKNILLIEDAALSLDSFFEERPSGSFGHLSAFSFHDTKNISCGEGGMLVINDDALLERAEIIREKGTNRKQFLNGQVSKYKWEDIGSSYLLSDITAAILFAQLEEMDKIQEKRLTACRIYKEQCRKLLEKGVLEIQQEDARCKLNGSVFYISCNEQETRDKLASFLREKGISTATHYLPLHESPYAKRLGFRGECPVATDWSERLLRLPLFYSISEEQQNEVIKGIESYFGI